MSAGFWRTQDKFEKEMGWSTREHIESAPEKWRPRVRLVELDYMLGRAYDEAVELMVSSAEPDLTGQSPDNSHRDIGSEAVDLMIFSRDALESLEKEPSDYLESLLDITEEHDDEYERLDSLLQHYNQNPLTTETDLEWVGPVQSRARDAVAQLSPATEKDNIYNLLNRNWERNLSSYQKEIGTRTAGVLLIGRDILEQLPDSPENYMNSKQEENRERAEHGDEFGTERKGYGKDGLVGIYGQEYAEPSLVARVMYGHRDWFNHRKTNPKSS